jgi:hypothetical protein
MADAYRRRRCRVDRILNGCEAQRPPCRATGLVRADEQHEDTLARGLGIAPSIRSRGDVHRRRAPRHCTLPRAPGRGKPRRSPRGSPTHGYAKANALGGRRAGFLLSADRRRARRAGGHARRGAAHQRSIAPRRRFQRVAVAPGRHDLPARRAPSNRALDRGHVPVRQGVPNVRQRGRGPPPRNRRQANLAATRYGIPTLVALAARMVASASFSSR